MWRPVVGALVVLGLAATPTACSDGGGDDDGSAEALCALVGDGGAYRPLFEDGFDPTDHDRAVAQLRAATTDLGELRAAAPSDLHDAIDDEVRYLESLLEVLDTTDPNDPAAVVAEVNALDEEREAAEVAGLELARFEAERCGTDAGTGGSAPDP